jgi:hypothetical protein
MATAILAASKRDKANALPRMAGSESDLTKTVFISSYLSIRYQFAIVLARRLLSFWEHPFCAQDWQLFNK